MNTEYIHFIGANGIMLPGYIWTPEREPQMVVQIVHGMTEHMGRYRELAEILTGHGIAVAGFDLRGHGLNEGDPNVASFGKNGWRRSLHDMFLFHLELNHRFPNAPFVMLGFSLGSFLVRDYLSRYNDHISGAVIMGTGHQPGMILSVLMGLIRREIRDYGFDSSTALVRKLSFETYNQKFAPNKTDADWLCADEAQLNKYRNDPLCRKHISAGLFWQLLDAMKRTGSVHTYKSWYKDTPVLLLSGAKDPVGDFGKGVRQVKRSMNRACLKDVQLHLIPHARHDLLHEKNSGAAEEAVDTLIKWLSARKKV